MVLIMHQKMIRLSHHFLSNDLIKAITEKISYSSKEEYSNYNLNLFLCIEICKTKDDKICSNQIKL